jgi:hypothetical protein
MKQYCHYFTDKGVGKVFLPMCMGGAVYGRSGCTCDRKNAEKSELEQLRQQVSKLQDQIDKLTKK